MPDITIVAADICDHRTDGTMCVDCQESRPLNFGMGILGTPIPQGMERIAAVADPSTVHRSAGENVEYELRFDLLDGPAMFEMAHVFFTGEKKYGQDNWRRYDVESFLNHVISHCYAYLAGDRNDSHLANIMCNALFAQAKALRPDYLGVVDPNYKGDA